ncbi:MAG: hypothetical protein EBE86_015715 [Hormoscilla sp. GUM202]|nr:hypothetical protein [Hormoscilla sp. GUM202]
MAKVAAPKKVTKSYDKDKKTLKVDWILPDDTTDITGYKIKVVNIYDQSVTFLEHDDANHSDTTYTFTSTEIAEAGKQDSKWKEKYQVWVQSTASNSDDNSDFTKSYYWTVRPSITIIIGSGDSEQKLKLTMTSEKGEDKTFELPVSEKNPLVISKTDFEAYLQTIGGALSIPYLKNYTPPVNLEIYRFVISTNGLFDFGLRFKSSGASKKWNIFPGLSIDNVGVEVLHTNAPKGSLPVA